MKLISDFIASVQAMEDLFLGLPLFLAPDYFFNPSKGWLEIRPFRHTTLESDHFDIVTQISLAGAGASLLTMFLARFVVAETTQERILLIKMKLISDLMLFPVIIYSAFFETSGFFDQQVFIILANYKLLSIALNLDVLRRRRAPGQRKTTGRSMGARLILLYSIPVGLLLYATPSLFAPGALLSSYYRETPLRNGAFDALETFAIRFEGSQILGFLGLYWEATKMTRLAYRTSVIFMTLYVFVFLRGLLDESGYCNLDVWKGNFVLHLLVLSLAWNLSRTKIEDFFPFKTYPHVIATEEALSADTLPELKTEPSTENAEQLRSKSL
jgi:hypothetical protein